MKPAFDSSTIFKITEGLALLVTFVVAIFFVGILYMIHRGSELPAILWCGNTITEPQAFVSNVLLPIGLFLHVLACSLAYVKLHTKRFLSLALSLLFIAVSIGILITGFIFCDKHLDGQSFRLFVWWM